MDPALISTKYQLKGQLVAEDMDALRSQWLSRDRRSDEGGNRLDTALELRPGMAASDPRDIVFANMVFPEQLIGQTAREIVRVDYSLSCAEVFTTVAEYNPMNLGLHVMLDLVEEVDPARRREGAPSWVADWTVRHDSRCACVRRSAVLVSKLGLYLLLPPYVHGCGADDADCCWEEDRPRGEDQRGD